MFESAVQPTAEGLEAGAGPHQTRAPTEAPRQVDGDGPLGRRYSAEDFQALTARLATGAAAAPSRRTASAPATIALPDLLAVFTRPDAASCEPEPDPTAGESDPGNANRSREAAAGEPLAPDEATAAEPVAVAAPGEANKPQEALPQTGSLQDAMRDGSDSADSTAEAAEAIAFEAPPAMQATGPGPDLPSNATASEPTTAGPPTEEGPGPSPAAGTDEPDEAGHLEERGPDADVRFGGNTTTVTETGGEEARTPTPSLPVTIDAAVADWLEAGSGLTLPDAETAVAIPAPDKAPGNAAEAAADPVEATGRSVAVPVWHDAFEADRQSGETARMLLDIMAMPSGAVQPQERALAGDTLLRLVSRMPIASVISLCERLCIMETPPPLLVRRLIHHPDAEVAGPLLERCVAVSDQDLMNLISSADPVRLRLIARRRHLSPALTDALIELGDSSVLLTVVRNPGAALSPEAFAVVAERAKSHHGLQAPLATRADTPAPIAFELFWSLPPELRRYVLSRFLTESATLDRILKIAHTLDDSSSLDNTVASRTADREQIDNLVARLADGDAAEAARTLSALAGICHANAMRIISDPAGEPLTVAMKALGLSRTQFAAAAETLNNAPAAPLRAQRRVGELKNLFDSLSFTKARVLLTYWDWALEQSGP